MNGSYEALKSGYKGLAKYYQAINNPDASRQASDAADALGKEEIRRNDEYAGERKYGYTDE